MAVLLGHRSRIGRLQPTGSGGSSRLPLGLLCVVCSGAVVVIVLLGARLTFFNDDWYFLLQRPGLESRGGLDVLLAPHNSNLVFVPALAYKLLVGLFGLGSQLPFRLLLAVSVVAVGVLLFLLVSARAGELVGLASAAVIVLLGAAWEDLLFFASVDLVGSVATGLGAMWALGRDTPRRRGLACLLLVCSVGFSNVGIPFAGAVAIAIMLRGRRAHLWVAAVPLFGFGLWWALDGSSEPSHLSAHNIEHLPRYIVDSASAGMASVAGLNRGTVAATYSRGEIVLGIAAIVLTVCVLRGWRPLPTVLAPLGGALIFWGLTGASFTPGREPFASRYQLIDATFLLLIGAEFLRGVRLGTIAGSAIVAITIAIVWSNVTGGLSYGYRFLREQSGYVKAELGALELGRRFAPPDLRLIAAIARNPFLSGVTAGRFFAETDAHGRVPTYEASEIESAPVLHRQAADSVLAFAERLPPISTSYKVRPSVPCRSLRVPPAGLSSDVALTPGAWLLSDVGRTGLAIGVHRFAPSELPVYIGLIASGGQERLTIPPDTAGPPWRLSVRGPAHKGASGLEVCPG